MNSLIFRLGALSACSSVIMQAGGGHKPWEIDRKLIFDKAFQIHMSSAIGMMLSTYKLSTLGTISGLLFLIGSGLFSGVAYYRCLNNDKTYNYLMPAGGTCVILGWLTLALS